MEKSILSQLNCTEDALKFSRNSSKDELRNLKILQEMCGKEVKRLMEQYGKTGDKETAKLAIKMGIKAQFCREAIEASEL